ncbi:MAG TPA: hypothetical protein VKA78_15655 [Pyrinomonadaceae bacterium]|nr:hypothetical protein [Pyrinomonadaceae bacterium]
MMTPQIPYRRNAIEPVQCIKDAWELVKNQYWLFVGMSLIAMLIGSAVPAGILLGPMMCGIYLTLFKLRRGEPIEFSMMFKGFDYFGPSLVATLLHIVPILAILLPAYFFFYISLVVSLIAQGDDPNPWAFLGVLALFLLFFLVIFVVVILISIGFTFAYPLIVDRKLPGLDAVKLSFKAAMANFWPLLGMVVLTSLLTLAGMMVCYIGMFLVFPVTYASVATAYERVFGLANPDLATNMPPPPPTFN